MKYDVLIVGAGAAGLMAGALACENGKNVLLFDKNDKTGRKLRITGKGRCNLCNNCSVTEVIENTISGGKFLFSALNSFSPCDLMDFFEHRGVSLKTERGNRVYPISEKADDIADLLHETIVSNNGKILKETVTNLIIEGDIVTGVKTSNGKYFSDKVIIATGGLSYKATGSTGDGYKFAKKSGHDVTELLPSLVGMDSKDFFIPELQGLSLKNVKVTLYKNEKEVYQDFGEMLFTHFGVSGPVILSASTKIRDRETYRLSIDLKPALNEEKLDLRLIRDFEEYNNKNFENYLPELLPKKLIPIVTQLCNIKSETKCHSITKVQRNCIIKTLKNLSINIEGLRPINEAVVTAGGVSLKQINPKTMESKIVKNLYFIGEVLDLDAYTGGFNLQIAFSTAYLAATHI